MSDAYRRNKDEMPTVRAYGYTGRLTAELAAARNIDVILAGRNRVALSELGDRLRLQTRVIRLDEPTRLSDALKDIACVVHMAGPFAVTSAPMAECVSGDADELHRCHW